MPPNLSLSEKSGKMINYIPNELDEDGVDEDGVAIFGAGDKTDDENVWVCSSMTQLLDDCLLQLGVEVF